MIASMSPAAPEFILVKASAGSGKTHALTKRYLGLALAGPAGPDAAAEGGGGLASILAITFTKNAAGEMKSRILDWLKEAYFGDAERIAQLREVVPVQAKAFPGLAGRAIDRILSDFADFQVETIDSFMASVFKASAVDLGFPPDFEIVLEHAELIDYAFYRHLRSVRAGSPEAADFDAILDYLLLYKGESSSFAWNPTPEILEKLTGFYARLTAREAEPAIGGHSKALADSLARLTAAAGKLEDAVEASGLEKNLKAPCFTKILPAVRDKRFSDLVGASFKTSPVRKPKGAKPGASGGDRRKGLDRARKRRSPLLRSLRARFLHSLPPGLPLAGRNARPRQADARGRLPGGHVPPAGGIHRGGHRPRHLLPAGRAGAPLPDRRVPGHLADAVAQPAAAGRRVAEPGREPVPRRRHQAGHLRLSRRRLPDHARPRDRRGQCSTPCSSPRWTA